MHEKSLANLVSGDLGARMARVIHDWGEIPAKRHVGSPESVMALMASGVCGSYLFARYMIPGFASHVYATLLEFDPPNDEQGTILNGISGLIQGELFNNNIFERKGQAHAHYWDMVEAYTFAGGDMDVVNARIASMLERKTTPSGRSEHFSTHLMNVVKDRLGIFMLVPAMEEATPRFFEGVLARVPQIPRFEKYRLFCQKHVDLDRGNHGPAALEWLHWYIQKASPPDDTIYSSFKATIAAMESCV